MGLIEDYWQGMVPLIVPLTLLKHHLNRHPVPDWVRQQVYLHPYPKELMNLKRRCLPNRHRDPGGRLSSARFSSGVSPASFLGVDPFGRKPMDP